MNEGFASGDNAVNIRLLKRTTHVALENPEVRVSGEGSEKF
jgi:hypothetical protein